MGVYIELPKEWAKWSFDVRDMHDNILKAKVTDLDLIRCGECNHSGTDGENTFCMWLGALRKPTDFCSYGERKDNEGTTE